LNAGGQGVGNRNDSSMDSSSLADQQSKLSNYKGGAALLVSSSTNFSNANSTNGTRLMKRTDQSSSHPQSQEQPPRAKKYRQREIEGASNSNLSNAGLSGIGSGVGNSLVGSDINSQNI